MECIWATQQVARVYIGIYSPANLMLVFEFFTTGSKANAHYCPGGVHNRNFCGGERHEKGGMAGMAGK
jgi:hypothetical protein